MLEAPPPGYGITSTPPHDPIPGISLASQRVPGLGSLCPPQPAWDTPPPLSLLQWHDGVLILGWWEVKGCRLSPP